jgi:hypothetical protein
LILVEGVDHGLEYLFYDNGDLSLSRPRTFLWAESSAQYSIKAAKPGGKRIWAGFDIRREKNLGRTD